MTNPADVVIVAASYPACSLCAINEAHSSAARNS
jgi:hypothetical protein